MAGLKSCAADGARYRLPATTYQRTKTGVVESRPLRGHRCSSRRGRLPAASHRERRDARRSRKRIGRRGIRVATAKKRTPRPSATPRREMPSAGNATPWRFPAHLALIRRSCFQRGDTPADTNHRERGRSHPPAAGSASAERGHQGLGAPSFLLPSRNRIRPRRCAFPPRRAGSWQQACLTGGTGPQTSALSAKRSLCPRRRAGSLKQVCLPGWKRMRHGLR